MAGNNSDFWGQTLEYGYKNKLGAKLPNEEFRSEKAYYANITDFFYDFRREPYFNARSAIRDQGECAASWAFSTVGNFLFIFCLVCIFINLIFKFNF